ncbi:alpha/beta hydrolase [Nocardioides sp. WS12]|uniref:alpha/beta fold hydrolase n=1 Tax=Nocardioides sp. WS12 TaxID=2486272 RepID=UPI0015FC2BCE|nr:alpha/beta hydrolase [Nocardioides sp. WS12]
MTAISHDRRGAGTPIVLVHGIGSRWQCFEPILDRLAEEHETIAIDLPGFGASPLADGVRPGPRGYADWLAGWLAENGIERPHLVGSSMGGGVALELGRRGIASGVTAFAPVGFWGAPGLRWTQGMLTGMRSTGMVAGPVLGRLVDHRAARIALLAGFFGHPSRVDPDVARADLAGLAAGAAFPAARKDFARYVLSADDDPGALPDIPVTVAWGTRDVVLIHRTQSARARVALPFAQHVDLAGCGHLPFNDDPATCARLVLSDAALRKDA